MLSRLVTVCVCPVVALKALAQHPRQLTTSGLKKEGLTRDEILDRNWLARSLVNPLKYIHTLTQISSSCPELFKRYYTMIVLSNLPDFID